MKKDILKNKIIFKRYKLNTRIGKGSFGFVYSGENIKDNTKVAIKLEDKTAKYHMLEKESNFLSILKGQGIPEVISYGHNHKYYILVQELLGESLTEILKESRNCRLSIKDVSLIALQILDRIEFVHSKNIVHRDMKPENFLFGLENPALLYLIDFGISRKYRSSRTGKHIKYSLTGKLFGTLKFLSYNATRGVEQSRRDDLESIGYVLVSLTGNRLPWQGYSIHGPKAKSNYEKILEIKKISNPKVICNLLPEEFEEYIKYCRKLNFEQDPDYEYLRNLFRNVLNQYDNINNLSFSWLNAKKRTKVINKEIKEEDSCSLSKEKYINLLRRKASPQIRLYHKIQKSLLNDLSAGEKLNLGKETIEEQPKNYNIHKRGISSDSTSFFYSHHSNLSKEGVSNDSVKVQYNVNIAEIGEKIKKEKESNQANSVLGLLKKNLINKKKNDNESYKNIFNIDKTCDIKISKKFINLSLDLDKNFLIDDNNNIKKKKARSQSPKHKTKELKLKYTEIEKRRRILCTKVYMNIINKFIFGFSTRTKKLKSKRQNKIIPKTFKKFQYQNKENNLVLNNINNINYLTEQRKKIKKIPNRVNNTLMNNNINNKGNTISNINLNQPRKMKIIKTKTVNFGNIKRKKNNSIAMMNTSPILDYKINSPIFNNRMNNSKIPNKRIIIINNNINSYNDNSNYTPHKYITIKERKELENTMKSNQIYNSTNNALKSIVPIHKKIFSYDDNQTKNILNNVNNRVLKMNNENNQNNNINYFNNNNPNVYNIMPKSNHTTYNFIKLPNKIINNRSNDDINKRVPKTNIKIYNYRSVINRSLLQNNKNNIIGKTKTAVNRIYLNPNLKRLNMNDMKIMKMNTFIPNLKQKSNYNKKYDYLINNTTNNIINPNQFLLNKYLTNEQNYRKIILNKRRKYLNKNIDNFNNYYKLDENNNRLFTSKSNVNFLENALKKSNKKQLEYKYNNSEDSKIFSFIPGIGNNLYEEKHNYKYNQNKELNYELL